MQACGFTNPRLHAAIARAIQQRVAAGEAADAVATVMAENWAQYCRDGPLLRFVWSPRKFFGEGHWRNWELWPIDQARADAMRNAKVGMR